MAKRRLPRILFELIESGVEDEHGLSRNEEAFRQYRFLPRYLGDISDRDQTATLFGRTYASPFGIAPTGFAALLRNRADFMLAEAARAADIPFIISGASAAPIKELAPVAPDHIWYHIYPAKDKAITTDILRRVKDAGLSKLVLTVDNPVYPNRERDTRNGFTLPLRLKLPILLEALTHPGWIAHYLRHGGMPFLDTWARYAGEGKSAAEVAAFFRSQSPSLQTWKDIEEIRRDWQGTFILKGIQHPEDALRAADLGIDGIIVSNHGGKSFDPLPSPLETLPMIKAALGDRIPIMMDSGIRRGYEALIARCLGADFVFVGRATLYGVVVAGREGADRAIEILRKEIDQSLALIGCNRFADLNGNYLLGGGQHSEPHGIPAQAGKACHRDLVHH
ncbi:alpha-hydroxy acid oxidase [Telmatospirillum sp. J64-1]|uniref:alpha-hydroxy acid oxidase n=1 Tax=Telmatospirillum sp. J64-1 TaxID=2502183 RepID=UPI001C8FA57C|nr:alpha-hydroxy acid oxidase [Telmatospirillum sp. J64-1]